MRDNISLSVLGRLQRLLGLIDGGKERKLVQDYIDVLGIKTPSMNTAVENLSGGNQQKVVVAKLAATEPKVLVLDEPTQGVDVQAKVDLLRIVDQLSQRGVAIGGRLRRAERTDGHLRQDCRVLPRPDHPGIPQGPRHDHGGAASGRHRGRDGGDNRCKCLDTCRACWIT